MSEHERDYLRISPLGSIVRVLIANQVVARSLRGLMLFEGSEPGVVYLPRDDASMAMLARSSHISHCPHKGEASYFSIWSESGSVSNAVWSYETPTPAAAAIAGYLAFDNSKVKILLA